MTRRYDKGAIGQGLPENPDRCVAMVYRGYSIGQCRNKRGFGPDKLYCHQHAKKLAAGGYVCTPEDE